MSARSAMCLRRIWKTHQTDHPPSLRLLLSGRQRRHDCHMEWRDRQPQPVHVVWRRSVDGDERGGRQLSRCTLLDVHLRGVRKNDLRFYESSKCFRSRSFVRSRRSSIGMSFISFSQKKEMAIKWPLVQSCRCRGIGPCDRDWVERSQRAGNARRYDLAAPPPTVGGV